MGWNCVSSVSGVESGHTLITYVKRVEYMYFCSHTAAVLESMCHLVYSMLVPAVETQWRNAIQSRWTSRVQVAWVIFTSSGDASRFDMYGVVVVTEVTSVQLLMYMKWKIGQLDTCRPLSQLTNEGLQGYREKHKYPHGFIESTVTFYTEGNHVFPF